MFEFFLALFGGAYLIYKYVGYKGDARRADMRERAWEKEGNERKEKWAQVLDEELESKINEITCLSRDAWREEPYFSEIINALKEMNAYNGGFNRLINYLEGGEKNITDDEGFKHLRTIILMVNRGKLPKWEHLFGVNIEQESAAKRSRFGLCSDIGCRYDLVLWISDKLKEFGIDVKPVLMTFDGHYYWLTDENRSGLMNFKWDIMVPPFVTIKDWSSR